MGYRSQQQQMNPALLQELLGLLTTDPKQQAAMRGQLNPLFGGPPRISPEDEARLQSMWNSPVKAKPAAAPMPPPDMGRSLWDMLLGTSPLQQPGYGQGR